MKLAEAGYNLDLTAEPPAEARPSRHHPESIVRILCGAGLIVLGGWIVLVIFAFASMVDPSLEGSDSWSEVLVHIDSGGGWPDIVLGLILIGGGILMVGTSVAGWFRNGPECGWPGTAYHPGIS